MKNNQPHAAGLLPAYLFNEHFILASLFWGTVAGGYLIFGWKQRSMIPFFAGLVMTAMSFVVSSALLMSAACLVVMWTVWWLLKQGY
ncbi:MAG: hypothetical protein KGR98_11870 [Verrucomicrobia bacterium]|nr:hypothetical protein [Verrucomicrobiota bacterium]MDE3100508.1 hypothetical protein [Verrucomicrobiota bacterium]